MTTFNRTEGNPPFAWTPATAPSATWQQRIVLQTLGVDGDSENTNDTLYRHHVGPGATSFSTTGLTALGAGWYLLTIEGIDAHGNVTRASRRFKKE